MDLSFRYATLEYLVDAITDYLNENSAHFKENRDPLVVDLYDVLKDACHKARIVLQRLKESRV